MASLKLQTNVPETIALEFADGLPVESQFGGDQVMFSLVDGRKWYASPFVAQKVAAAGIAAKQPFTICKREVSQGNRRTVEYQIEAAAAFSQNATAAVGSTSSSNLTSQSYNGNAARSLHVMSAPPAAPAPPPPAASPAASTDSSAVALMKIAGCGAIDAVLEMESYARAKGMTDFVLGSENIQKIAVTLFLSMKGGR